MPAGIGLLSACILPHLTQSAFSHPVFERLCQRFLENWETLDAAGKIAVLEGISPVMKEMLYAGTAGLLGLMTILTLAMRGWAAAALDHGIGVNCCAGSGLLCGAA